MSETFQNTMRAYVEQNPEKFFMRLSRENRRFIIDLYRPTAQKRYGYTGDDFKVIYSLVGQGHQKVICDGIARLLAEENEKRCHRPKGNAVIIPFPGATAVSQKSKANTARQR